MPPGERMAREEIALRRALVIIVVWHFRHDSSQLFEPLVHVAKVEATQPDNGADRKPDARVLEPLSRFGKKRAEVPRALERH